MVLENKDVDSELESYTWTKFPKAETESVIQECLDRIVGVIEKGNECIVHVGHPKEFGKCKCFC